MPLSKYHSKVVARLPIFSIFSACKTKEKYKNAKSDVMNDWKFYFRLNHVSQFPLEREFHGGQRKNLSFKRCLPFC